MLLDHGGSLELAQLTNASAGTCRFEFQPEDIEAAVAESRGARLVGTFHSHIVSEAVPGETDVRHALGELMLVIDTCERSARLWRVAGGRAVECAFDVVAGRRGRGASIAALQAGPRALQAPSQRRRTPR